MFYNGAGSMYACPYACLHVYTCVCENPSYKNIQRSCRDAGEGLGDPSPRSGSEQDGCRWKALRHHLGRQGGPKVPQKGDTSLVTRDVPSTSTPPAPKRHLTFPIVPPAFNQLIIKRKKIQNLKQGKRERREEKTKTHNYSCASMLHKPGVLQKLGQAGWGVLGRR